MNVGDYTYVNALTNLITVESLLFASFSLAVNLSGPSAWGDRKWLWRVNGKQIAAAAVVVLALVAAGAGFAWWQIFGGSEPPDDIARAMVAIGVAAAIVGPPILAFFLAMGLRDE